MPVCPSCRDEFVAGIARCPECDVELLEGELPDYSVDALNAGDDIHELAMEGQGELEAVASGNLESIKEVVGALRRADVPAIVAPVPGQEGVRFAAVVAASMLGQAQKVLQDGYEALIAAEGTVDPSRLQASDGEGGESDADGDGPLVCPACGYEGELDADGACADCGIMLGG